MKKSVIFSLHISYWLILYAGINFFHLFATRLLSMRDVGLYLAFLQFSTAVWFYIAYFLLFRYFQRLSFLLYTLGGLTIIGTILYFLYPTGFAFYLLTLTKAIPWCVTGLLFRYFIDWMKKDKAQIQLSQQNLKSELALLRTQINPHFLFNSLNNIDTLITVNPEKASHALLKLSEMMRYMLYDANTDKVKLTQETEYIQQYVNLQQLRLPNPDLIELYIHLQPETVLIAPMLFIPFVENAFKHTTDKTLTHGISILIKQEKNSIYFKTVNIFNAAKTITKDETSGIGLINVRKRLELLYPHQYQLKIKHENDRYIVELILYVHA